MKGRVLGALLVGAAVGLTILSCSPPQQAVNGQPAAKSQQWEYRIEDHGRKAEEFNKLGADGWEYAGTMDRGYSVFKRPKR